MTFSIIRILFLLAVVGVGIFRLYKNFLKPHERSIYWMLTLSGLWFAVTFTLSFPQVREMFHITSTTVHTMSRIGWPILSTAIVLMMFYYRRLPRQG